MRCSEIASINGFLLASLVHDIGHYPYAHVIEQYVASRFSWETRVAKNMVSHAEHTIYLLQDEKV